MTWHIVAYFHRAGRKEIAAEGHANRDAACAALRQQLLGLAESFDVDNPDAAREIRDLLDTVEHTGYADIGNGLITIEVAELDTAEIRHCPSVVTMLDDTGAAPIEPHRSGCGYAAGDPFAACGCPEGAVAVFRATIMVWDGKEWHEPAGQRCCTVHVTGQVPFPEVADHTKIDVVSRCGGGDGAHGVGVVLYVIGGPSAGTMIGASQEFFDRPAQQANRTASAQGSREDGSWLAAV